MKIAVHSGNVEDQFVNYPMPQENGNKTDTRWVRINNSDGVGLRIEGSQLFNTSFRKYSTKNLAEALHPFDLVPQKHNILNIDFGQGPIGNQSCGPKALEEYWLEPNEKSMWFKFSYLD